MGRDKEKYIMRMMIILLLICVPVFMGATSVRVVNDDTVFYIKNDNDGNFENYMQGLNVITEQEYNDGLIAQEYARWDIDTMDSTSLLKMTIKLAKHVMTIENMMRESLGYNQINSE